MEGNRDGKQQAVGSEQTMGHIDDMKELIRQEIQSIGTLEERVAFKTLMEEVFLSIYEENEHMYTELEHRVQDELAYDVNRYLVKTGVIERQMYDTTHHLMFPMDERDLETEQYGMDQILESVRAGEEFRLMKVMLRCDYLQIQKLWKKEMEFDAVIETTSPEREWGIRVRLHPNTEYLQKIGHLYHLFIKNGIPWQTINTPYLYKMADICVTKLPEGIDGTETIRRIRFQFGEYHSVVCQDLIPIWNIRKLSLDSIGFPIPCGDHKSFEHSISIKEYGIQHAYLAEDDKEIQSIRQRAERLTITSRIQEAKKWEVYVIQNAQDNRIDHYTYPVIQNERAENFSEKFQRKWNQSIKTQAELARFIRGFGLEEYAAYQSYEILEQFQGKKETYSMNPFIEDEIRDTRMQRKLLLCFHAGEKEPWLQRDIASFIVSEVQRLYPEYECGGMIV